MPPSKPWISLRHRRHAAEKLALLVIALHLSLIAALLFTPGKPPAPITLFELLWAAARKPMFYFLLLSLTAAPVLSCSAWRTSGRHRAWLMIGWLALTLTLLFVFPKHIAAMFRVLWWQFGA